MTVAQTRNARRIAAAPKPTFPDRGIDQAFVMCLALVFSIPILLGHLPPPGTIDALMPSWMVYAWATALAVGAFTILTSYLIRDRVSAVIVEQFGSIVIGIPAMAYGIAIFYFQFNQGGAISGSIILGFAAARFYQAYRYQKFVKRVRTVLDIMDEEGGEGSGR